MDRSHWLPIGIAALFTLAAAAWMMPPTQPVVPASNANVLHPRPHASDPVVPAPDIAAPDSLDSMSTPPPAAVATPVETYAPAAPAVAATVPPRPRQAPDRELADGRDPSQSAFHWGYRWAERNGIDDVEDCGVWEGSPREDGCRSFVEAQDESDPSEEDVPQPYS